MRHREKRHLLAKPADQRKALLRGLSTELLRHGKITTTLARAKAMQTEVEQMITMAKKPSLHHRRLVASYLLEKRRGSVSKLDSGKKYDESKFKLVKKVDKVLVLQEKTVLQRLFDEIAPKYANTSGGYTRIIKTDFRRGDNASMAVIELV